MLTIGIRVDVDTVGCQVAGMVLSFFVFFFELLSLISFSHDYLNIGIPPGLYTLLTVTPFIADSCFSLCPFPQTRTRTCVCLSCLSSLVTPINNEIIDKTIRVLGNETGAWEHQNAHVLLFFSARLLLCLIFPLFLYLFYILYSFPIPSSTCDAPFRVSVSCGR